MASRILAEGQFRHSPSLWQRFVNWLHDNLSFSVPTGPAGALADLVLAALLVAVVAVIVLAVRNGAVRRLGHPRRSSGVVVLGDDVSISAEAWLSEASRLATLGRYRESLRCRYRALLARLSALGVVTEVPGRTSGDYERAVRDFAPALGAPFSAATHLFENCWYGEEPCDAGAQRLFDQLAATALARVGPR